MKLTRERVRGCRRIVKRIVTIQDDVDTKVEEHLNGTEMIKSATVQRKEARA